MLGDAVNYLPDLLQPTAYRYVDVCGGPSPLSFAVPPVLPQWKSSPVIWTTTINSTYNTLTHSLTHPLTHSLTHSLTRAQRQRQRQRHTHTHTEIRVHRCSLCPSHHPHPHPHPHPHTSLQLQLYRPTGNRGRAACVRAWKLSSSIELDSCCFVALAIPQSRSTGFAESALRPIQQHPTVVVGTTQLAKYLLLPLTYLHASLQFRRRGGWDQTSRHWTSCGSNREGLDLGYALQVSIDYLVELGSRLTVFPASGPRIHAHPRSSSDVYSMLRQSAAFATRSDVFSLQEPHPLLHALHGSATAIAPLLSNCGACLTIGSVVRSVVRPACAVLT